MFTLCDTHNPSQTTHHLIPFAASSAPKHDPQVGGAGLFSTGLPGGDFAGNGTLLVWLMTRAAHTIAAANHLCIAKFD